MKLADLLKKRPEKEIKFKSHSEEDLLAALRKVIEGAHFNTHNFELQSSDADLRKGDLKFKYKTKKYKITKDGKISEGSKVIYEIEPNNDLHHHYSSALHKIVKKIEEEIANKIKEKKDE